LCTFDSHCVFQFFAIAVWAFDPATGKVRSVEDQWRVAHADTQKVYGPPGATAHAAEKGKDKDKKKEKKDKDEKKEKKDKKEHK
jgi:hypothetical protein